MDTRKIKKLIELVKEMGIGELEVKSGDESVRINCQTIQPVAPTLVATTVAPTQAAVIPSTAEEKPAKKEIPDGHNVTAPMVGTVYIAPQPGSPPFVSVGEHVNVGDTLCLIEAMKMFNKIEADKAGKISARLVDNEQPVEYDQPLFIIDTNE